MIIATPGYSISVTANNKTTEFFSDGRAISLDSTSAFFTCLSHLHPQQRPQAYKWMKSGFCQYEIYEYMSGKTRQHPRLRGQCDCHPKTGRD